MYSLLLRLLGLKTKYIWVFECLTNSFQDSGNNTTVDPAVYGGGRKSNKMAYARFEIKRDRSMINAWYFPGMTGLWLKSTTALPIESLPSEFLIRDLSRIECWIQLIIHIKYQTYLVEHYLKKFFQPLVFAGWLWIESENFIANTQTTVTLNIQKYI